MVYYSNRKYAVGLFCLVMPLWGAAFSQRAFKKKKKEMLQSARFTLTADFEGARDIPKVYTCDGQAVSPELRWENPPEGTKSFALICYDSDNIFTGMRVHWIVYDIDKSRRMIPQQLRVESIGARHGINSWGYETYTAPCPPVKKHRYFFVLYALDVDRLHVQETPPDYELIMEAMKGHIIDQARLMGKYQRTKGTE